ncbi:hypothetical protein SO802_008273 [Lithocarpus litseifolius]|uniref:EF-hand domain-containing protein n=1 Tax=Lithocarpus litseifolius TaxID=425828 RepID=A0AAW2DDN4_9ROSI
MSNYHHLSVSTFGLFLLILCVPSYGRFITICPLTSDLISDGVQDCDSAESSTSTSTSTCHQTYGFLPCTTSVMGNLFLMVVYGYLMYLAAKLLSDGSELLLEILRPGFVAGLVLPILGALPEALLVLVSGIFGSTETAQSQVSVGMGMVAGSTIIILTIIWGSSVVVGKCDLVDSIAQDARDTKGFSSTESGVSTEIWTCYAAMIMVASIIPLLIVQIPQILNLTSGRHFAVLIGLIVSLLLLVSYILYQVRQPDIQRRKIAYVKHKYFMLGLLTHLKQRSLGRLLDENGQPDTVVIQKLFSSIDENGDGRISHDELRALIAGIRFEEVIDLNLDDAVNKLMIDFDTSGNSAIESHEFVTAISNWLSKIGATAACNAGLYSIKRTFNDFYLKEHDLLDVSIARDPSDEVVESAMKSKWDYVKAAQLLLLGTIIAAAFADPLVDVVDNFSDATSIPAFFISFIVLPLATSSRDAVSAIIFASHKKRSSTSLTFYEIYGSVTMHNVFNLPVFLALVYFRGLTWDFSSEVLVILILSIVIGALASFRTHFPMWTSILAFLLYPFSLALAYVLHYVYGWS